MAGGGRFWAGVPADESEISGEFGGFGRGALGGGGEARADAWGLLG